VGLFSGSRVPKLDLKSGSLLLENQKFQESSKRYGQTAFALTEKEKRKTSGRKNHKDFAVFRNKVILIGSLKKCNQ